MNPEYLVTHSGGFHADELCSTAVLSTLFPSAKIVRSRSKEWISASPDKIVYDVGGVFDASIHAYDHHQRGAPLRKDGQPYSSFGLIWEHFGRAYLGTQNVPTDQIEIVHKSIDTSFVLPIDLLDNGAIDPSVADILSPLTLPNLLETLKPTFDSEKAEGENLAFHDAVKVAKLFIEAQVSQAAAHLRAENLVKLAIKESEGKHVLELPKGMPFWSAVNSAKAEHLLFVVHPRGQGDWALGGIRTTKDSFELRANLPQEWGGLTNIDLERVSGVTGATFCHNGLFIAAATSRKAILAMAQIAVDNVLSK
ncbi:MYG1 family protein [uncultured Pelagimonas sp.]|uniref:MYG1 family protein n=1 Tax=uncultured Pelagimonas sp. TaxID=1618102 RepID=UPI00262ACD1C|nr:MYG1 family protein [uncultured Pelagimonas sp.]